MAKGKPFKISREKNLLKKNLVGEYDTLKEAEADASALLATFKTDFYVFGPHGLISIFSY